MNNKTTAEFSSLLFTFLDQPKTFESLKQASHRYKAHSKIEKGYISASTTFVLRKHKKTRFTPFTSALYSLQLLSEYLLLPETEISSELHETFICRLWTHKYPLKSRRYCSATGRRKVRDFFESGSFSTQVTWSLTVASRKCTRSSYNAVAVSGS